MIAPVPIVLSASGCGVFGLIGYPFTIDKKRWV